MSENQFAQGQVDNWNADHPVFPIVVEVTKDDGTVIRTTTASAAFLLGGHTPCIFLQDISGCFLLSRVKSVGGIAP